MKISAVAHLIAPEGVAEIRIISCWLAFCQVSNPDIIHIIGMFNVVFIPT